MSNFEPEIISLEDLQGLAESFANLNMVDLKMNPQVKAEEEAEASEQRRRHHADDLQTGPGYIRRRESITEDVDMMRTRARKRRPKLQDTHVEKATLEPLHPYGVMLDIDEVDFKDIEGLIDE